MKIGLLVPEQFQKPTAEAILLFCLNVIVSLSFPLVATAQVRPVYDQGALGLSQLLKRLNTSATILMIGAHPDDEDTAFLAYLARGESARTAYLSLTRGDGGQNIIGRELGESLGLIRTEELLQARRLDGAEQYFTRAYDYGFSKTLAEAKQKWDENIVLCDVVRVIREFRPLVVVSQFNGTPADGHGQHQYAGYISPLAVTAARDVGKCNGTGEVWDVKKFYVRHRGNDEPTLRINTGKYDPLIGRSYFEIAMEARSQHKSQEQGVLELKGEQFSSYDVPGGAVKETSVFETIDTSVTGIASNAKVDSPATTERLLRLQQIAREALGQYLPGSPEKIASLLAEGYVAARDAKQLTRNASAKSFIEQKEREFLAALQHAAGIQIDALADRETVVQGEEFPVNVRVFTGSPGKVAVQEITLATQSGKKLFPTERPADSAAPTSRREKPNYSAFFKAALKDGPDPTQPYWLGHPREGDLYNWHNEPGQTLPFRGPVLNAELKLTVDGRPVEISVPVEYRFADDVRGEVRRELNVVPALTLELDQELVIVPSAKSEQTRRIVVSVLNNSPSEQAGTVSVELRGIAQGDRKSLEKDFVLARRGQRVSFTFDVAIPAGTLPGKYDLYARASTMSKGAKHPTVYGSKMMTIAYPHIRTHRFYRQAKAEFRLMDLAVSPVRVGYIEGSGDRVPEAIMQMGIPVDMLSDNDLASSNLSRFDVIVVGIRAYQVRPEVVANNQRLIDFANSGGTLIVQYQLPFAAGLGVLPYPAQMGPRVSDENAAVTILKPEHPVFNSPNKITQEDFKGWVQERNLYNFSTFHSSYVPLLEAHDADEPVNSGGLVVADLGKGKYVYCSYSLFRQLPAGVPGAYRLLANLLSLKATAR